MMYRYTTLLRQTASNALESSSSVSSTLKGNYRLLSLSLTHTHTHTEFILIAPYMAWDNELLSERAITFVCPTRTNTNLWQEMILQYHSKSKPSVHMSRLWAENVLASHPNCMLTFSHLTWQDANFWSWLVGNVECGLCHESFEPFEIVPGTHTYTHTHTHKSQMKYIFERHSS